MNELEQLKVENEKMREVLEMYAQQGISFDNADWDVGEDARDVLKELYGVVLRSNRYVTELVV